MKPIEPQMIALLAQMLEEECQNTIYILKQSKNSLRCIPASWKNLIPKIGKKNQDDWLYLKVFIKNKKCYTCLHVKEIKNLELRKSIIERLIASPSEFDLDHSGEITDHWTRLGSHTLDHYRGTLTANAGAVVQMAFDDINNRIPRLAFVPQAIQEVLANQSRSF